METPEEETKLPEKIFPVNYAGFWDFSLDGCYDASPLNEMDFPNAGEIAAEVSKRYNEYSALKEEILLYREALKEMLNRYAPYGSGDSDARGAAIQKAESALSKFQPKKP